jgi:C4-type Zn-finger protein
MGVAGAHCGRSDPKFWAVHAESQTYELRCPSCTTQLDTHETQITGAFQLVFLVSSCVYHACVGSGRF